MPKKCAWHLNQLGCKRSGPKRAASFQIDNFNRYLKQTKRKGTVFLLTSFATFSHRDSLGVEVAGIMRTKGISTLNLAELDFLSQMFCLSLIRKWPKRKVRTRVWV